MKRGHEILRGDRNILSHGHDILTRGTITHERKAIKRSQF